MLFKLLFTVTVIFGVIIFFRYQNQRAARQNNNNTNNPSNENEITEQDTLVSPQTMAYSLLGILLVLSVAIFAFSWHTDNQIVTIRVIANGETTQYFARHKSIHGRNFVTLDGIQIALGESDRIEITHP